MTETRDEPSTFFPVMMPASEMHDIDDQDLSELDSLLNDPDVPMQADRVWELLAKMSSQAAHSLS